jgi:hypothetical protein
MRFKKEKSPKVGDKRITSYFAFLPITVDNEIRWLENVTIEEEFTKDDELPHPMFHMWEKIRFID